MSKILLLALVIGAVWFGWRWVNRVNAIGRDRAAAKRRDGASTTQRSSTQRSSTPPPSAASSADAEDMEKCPECGAYVAPRSAVSCGRPACPYGR